MRAYFSSGKKLQKLNHHQIFKFPHLQIFLVNYWLATTLKFSVKLSSIALSPMLSKNDLEAYFTSNLERSTVATPCAVALLPSTLMLAGKVTGFVIPLMVRSPVTL